MKKACVLGAGAFGTALAKQLADKNIATTLWARRPELSEAINDERRNARYLPDAALPDSMRATSDLSEATREAELVVFCAPSHATRAVVAQVQGALPPRALLCSATKGIETESLMLMSELMVDVLGADAEQRLGYLSGPSFAKELAAKQPTAVTVASTHSDTARAIQRAFAADHLRVYVTEDVVGVEMGGALKNVIAIAAGAIDGLGFGLNARAALITRGLAEIGRLATAKGASPLTLAGLAGAGDLLLTCTGSLSRNRSVGVELGKGRTLSEILAALGQVAEGVKTTKSAYHLGKELGVELPEGVFELKD